MVVVLLSLVVCGCAITTPHLTIRQWPVEQRALYYQQPAPYRVAVLPLIDQRPKVEHAGQKARPMFLLLWNRRSGDYYTSDIIFGNEVGHQLGERLAAYLKAGNVFHDVRYAPTSSDSLNLAQPLAMQQLAQTQQVDYLLGGELQHFFGSQHQHFNMYVLPLYFINTWGSVDQKSLPWGNTSLRVALIDGRSGDLLWRRPFEANQTLPRETDSMAQAAMESFVQVAGQVATELRNLPFESLQHNAELSQQYRP